ncbi:MAG: L-serine ammonia-lyase, iron-sulfur-dependent subunit beta [Clostridia bacterium]|nr:L-serine ammonia-lyase, iron-sulfur-dependent subunit beta [Clostridia bacterium]
MTLFDVVGPVMVGPSSSHTAGAVRIGYIAGKLLGEKIKKAQINLYGSFFATGRGHGTDRALMAGLLGFRPDDERIPSSFALAAEQGIDFKFGEAMLREGHPNSAQIILDGIYGTHIEVIGESIGGGRINISHLDGQQAGFSGEYPTLIVYNLDQPGRVAEVTAMLAGRGINIVSMHLQRSNRGGNAVMVIECDQEVPVGICTWFEGHPGIEKVKYLNPEEYSNV